MRQNSASSTASRGQIAQHQRQTGSRPLSHSSTIRYWTVPVTGPAYGSWPSAGWAQISGRQPPALQLYGMYLSVISEALGVILMSLFCFIQLPKLCHSALSSQSSSRRGLQQGHRVGHADLQKSTLYWDTCSMIWVVRTGLSWPRWSRPPRLTNRRTARVRLVRSEPVPVGDQHRAGVTGRPVPRPGTRTSGRSPGLSGWPRRCGTRR